MGYLELEGVPLASLSDMAEGQDWLELETDAEEDSLAWRRVAVMCVDLQGEAEVRMCHPGGRGTTFKMDSVNLKIFHVIVYKNILQRIICYVVCIVHIKRWTRSIE